MIAPQTSPGTAAVQSATRRGRASILPWWAIAAFCAAVIGAYFATVIHVFGIHGDYEQLLYKSDNPFFFNDAPQALSIARPILILDSNIPLSAMHTIADFRWARAFSILTVCFLGIQMMHICIRHLRILPLHALTLAIATFLIPGFAYSIMNLASWGPHLVSIAVAFWAYAVLSATNIDAFLLQSAARPGNAIVFARRCLIYAMSRRFLGSLALMLVAMYNYPTNSLIICLFPVLVLLFSSNPRFYRMVIACRDIAFIGVTLAAYMITTKLIYFPLLEALYGLKPFPVQGPGSAYRFVVQLDPFVVLRRLEDALRVSANLWFLPQSHFYLGSIFLVLSAMGLATFRSKRAEPTGDDAFARLKLNSWKADGAGVLAAQLVCYLLALAPVLYSAGGFVDYRTIIVATGLTAALVIYALWANAGMLAAVFQRQRDQRALWAGGALASFMLFAIGIAATHVGATVKLAGQELAYATAVAQKTVRDEAKTLVVIDPRPEFLPNEYPVAEDRAHHAILPYELGCFSSVCLSLGGIFEVGAQQAGLGVDPFAVEIFRGSAARSVTCTLFAAKAEELPADLPPTSAARIAEIRARGRVECIPYDFTWFDLGGRPD